MWRLCMSHGPLMTTARIHLARPGTYRDAHGRTATLSAERLKGLAENYRPGSDKAPLVLGHPKDGAPAHGWVDALEFDETSGLWGEVSQFSTDLAEAVRDGRYKRVSISIYPKGGKTNPTPEHEALRHVGVLGAQVPAIRGLIPLELSEDDDVVTIEFSESDWAGWWGVKNFMRGLRDWIIDQSGTETADRVIPAYLIDSVESASRDAMRDDDDAPAFSEPKPELKEAQPVPKDTPPADFAEREADIDRRLADLKTREDAQAAKDAAAAEASSFDFADSLIEKGCLAPAKRETVAAIHRKLAGADEPLSFSDGKTEDSLKGFEKLFEGARPVIDLSERSAPDQSSEVDAGDPDALSKRAKALQKEDDSLSFAEAVRLAEDEAGDAA